MKTPQTPTPSPISAPAQDAYHGQGGSYEINPETGIRTRTQAPTAPAETAPKKE